MGFEVRVEAHVLVVVELMTGRLDEVAECFETELDLAAVVLAGVDVEDVFVVTAVCPVLG